MRSGTFVLILLVSVEYLGCSGGQAGVGNQARAEDQSRAGGQSGPESIPADCGDESTRSVGLDEDTSLGTAREFFDSAASPATTSLRWYTHDRSSYSGALVTHDSDTTVTLYVTGDPGTASYSWRPRLRDGQGTNDLCQATLEVGARLHFETADGVFNESIPGVLTMTNDSANSRSFDASLTPNFGGSYDGSQIAQQYGTSDLELVTSFSPAGRLRVKNTNAWPSELARWPVPEEDSTVHIVDGG